MVNDSKMREDKDLIEERVRDLLTTFVSSGQTGGGISIVEILRELDQICREHKRSLSPQLIHYMERRSYQKALTWLETGEREREEIGHE